MRHVPKFGCRELSVNLEEFIQQFLFHSIEGTRVDGTVTLIADAGIPGRVLDRSLAASAPLDLPYLIAVDDAQMSLSLGV